MSNTPLIIYACVATGSLQGQADYQIDRLYCMLSRFSPSPFKLLCITDQHRSIHPDIIQIDGSSWVEFRLKGTHPTYYKLALFNSEYIPFQDIFYLDLSVIIQATLLPIIEFANKNPDDLVIVKDWALSEVNSSVMRIRNTKLRFIHDEFVAGTKYPEQVQGDQDFIAGAMHAHNLSFSFFHQNHIVSFKNIMRQGVTDWQAARTLATESIIVKFHGQPKPATIFEFGYVTKRYGLRYWARGRKQYPFDFRHLKHCWSLPLSE